jgi:DNA-binding response OmpR family regulator
MPEAKNKKILIIDDDKDYGDALKIVLENNGYAVIHALNIADGRASVEKNPPDLIILDVMMEKHTDGFDLCADLKNDQACSMIPIIMVTAVTEKTGFKFSPVTDGEYLQANDYISKPVAVSVLLSRVNKLLGEGKAC